MFCTNCGSQIPEGSKFCTNCGTLQEAVESAAPVFEEPAVEAPAYQEPVFEQPQYEEPAYQEPVYQEPQYEEPEMYTDPVYEAPKKKSKKGLVITVVALILVAVLGAGGYFGYTWYMDKKNAEAYAAAEALLAEKDYDGALAAFQALKNYEDSADRVLQLQQWEEDYDAALELLEEEDYAAAQEAFTALGDYMDSAAQALTAGNKLTYNEANALLTEAASQEDYAAAGEMLAGLGDYEDAPQLASAAYLSAAKSALNSGDVDTAEGYAQNLNEDDKEEYESLFGDSVFFERLEQALQYRYDRERGTSPDELAIARELEDMIYRDQDLADAIADYVYALELQESVLDSDGYIPWGEDYVTWLEGELQRDQIMDLLNDQYGFLDDNAELYEANIGWQLYDERRIAIENSLIPQLWEASETQIGSKYYMLYTNDVGFTFTLWYKNIFRDDAYNVISEEEYEYVLNPGDEIQIPVSFPNGDCQWYIDWEYYDFEY